MTGRKKQYGEKSQCSAAIGPRCDRDVIERGFIIHEVFRNAV